MAFIAGGFTATFKPVGGQAADIGATEDGFEIIETPHYEPIHTDEFGDGLVDGVHRGTDCVLRWSFAEYEMVKAAVFNSHNRGDSKTGVGSLMSSTAGEIVLTPRASTPAAALGTYTFYHCFCESDILTLLKNGLRKGQVTFRILPSTTHSNKFYNVA